MTNNTRTLYTPLAMLIMVVLLMASICAALIYKAKADYWQNLPLADRVIAECQSENVGEDSGHTEDYAALLRAAGWQGDPTDGGEILYSPACEVPNPATYVPTLEAEYPEMGDVFAEGDDNGDEFLTPDESGWVSIP